MVLFVGCTEAQMPTPEDFEPTDDDGHQGEVVWVVLIPAVVLLLAAGAAALLIW